MTVFVVRTFAWLNKAAHLQICLLMVVYTHEVMASLSREVGNQARLAAAGGALQQDGVPPQQHGARQVAQVAAHARCQHEPPATAYKGTARKGWSNVAESCWKMSAQQRRQAPPRLQAIKMVGGRDLSRADGSACNLK